MIINELLIKPKKPKKAKKKVLKEASFVPEPKKPIMLGGVEFTPPFYPLGNQIVDVNHKPLCTCENRAIAVALSDVLWEIDYENR